MKIEQKIALDHIAILVEDLQISLSYCAEKEWPIGRRDRFESEGTEEIYIGEGGGSRLLLMEAIGPGPYQNALEKRGPGIHHFGLVCENIDDYVVHLKKIGWSEHHRSQLLWEQTKTFWMQHQGMPFLEISEAKTFPILDFSIVLPLPEILFGMLPGVKNGPVTQALLGGVYRSES